MPPTCNTTTRAHGIPITTKPDQPTSKETPPIAEDIATAVVAEDRTGAKAPRQALCLPRESPHDLGKQQNKEGQTRG
eukprot:12439647-Ditylum_brightwellii.AAC.1